jgi:hypothetical protein
MSISEFIAYAVKTANTARLALRSLGIAHPENHIMIYRSSWNVRILVSKKPFGQDAIAKMKSFCSDRSFDTSYYPGIDPRTVTIWNDLPSVSFDNEQVTSAAGKVNDALMDAARELMSRNADAALAGNFFNLRPATNDNPFFYSILRPAKLKKILGRIALIPREEIGWLINIAVLLQAVIFALFVLFLPVIRRTSARPAAGSLVRRTLYFAGLGLGFLFIEIVLIEKFTLFLNDRTSSFSIVIASMLIFSGLGSFLSSRFIDNPGRGVRIAVAVIAAAVIAYAFLLNPIIAAAIRWPFIAKCFCITVLIAPLSIAMGFPFPLGLSSVRGENNSFLPWAWSINGAFSVIATPLANILAVSYGYTPVFLLSILLYVLVAFTRPVRSQIKTNS